MEKEYGALKDSTKDGNTSPGGKTDAPKGMEWTCPGW